MNSRKLVNSREPLARRSDTAEPIDTDVSPCHSLQSAQEANASYDPLFLSAYTTDASHRSLPDLLPIHINDPAAAAAAAAAARAHIDAAAARQLYVDTDGVAASLLNDSLSGAAGSHNRHAQPNLHIGARKSLGCKVCSLTCCMCACLICNLICQCESHLL